MASSDSDQIRFSEKPRNERLKENRKHGIPGFPCSMYVADYRLDGSTPDFHCRPHWQNEIEILHFEEGEYQYAVNMDSGYTTEECFIFVNSGELHSLDTGEGYVEQALLFQPTLLSSGGMDAAEEAVIGPLMRGELAFPRYIGPDSPAFPVIRREYANILHTFEQAGEIRFDQHNAPGAASQMRIRAGILNILAELSEQDLLTSRKSTGSQRGETLKKVVTYIRDHYPEKIYIRDLADIMNMNEQYFCRFFKKATNRTPIAYINEVRIRHAVLLMKQSDRSITEIALGCGFGNMGHFIEEFRKITGETPRAYRARLGSERAQRSRYLS